MKKILPIFLASLLLLSSCSVDWNDEKDKKISELEEKQIVSQSESKLFNNSLESDKLILDNKKLNFEYDLKCQERADLLRKKHPNINAWYYNIDENKCYIKIYDRQSNSIQEWPIDEFWPTNNLPKSTNYNVNENTLADGMINDNDPVAESAILWCNASGSVLKLRWSTADFDFLVCTKNDIPERYVWWNKKTKDQITVFWSDNAFVNQNYKYLPPWYGLNKTNDLQIYKDNKIIFSDHVLSSYIK